MDDQPKEPEPTQPTQPAKGKPVEIPVPTHGDVMRDLEKIAKPQVRRKGDEAQ